jgi:hypothetical protein
MPEWLWKLLFAAVVLQIPFEFRWTLLGLSNLQWTFVGLAVCSIPLLFKNRRPLMHDRLIQAAALFVAIQWAAAVYAPDFHTNAIKASVRFTAGFILLAIVRAANAEKFIVKYWVIAASVAAAYALFAYAGLGLSELFRTEEFYIGQIQRLSGSFEYPNTAAAYFAMSLPIVWWSPLRLVLRLCASFVLWCATVLTFSKGALVAIPVALLLARSKEWKRAVVLVTIGIASYLILLPLNPYLIERIHAPAERNTTAAEYGTDWNTLQQQPGKFDIASLTIRNSGVNTWRVNGRGRVSLGYRWWDTVAEAFLDEKPIVTLLPHNIVSGESTRIQAAFRTPERPGRYLLVFELFSDLNWFSWMHVVPLLIQADIKPNADRIVQTADVSALYKRGQRPGLLGAGVGRLALWTAALKIFQTHPFGIGPDNYRLEYGKYLGATRWDTKVYSNNLYLEILVGSGVLGLTAFLIMLGMRRWDSDAASMGAGIFLVHGVVDVFLMATPVYFAFWLLLGMPKNATDYADDTDEGIRVIRAIRGWKSKVEVQ